LQKTTKKLLWQHFKYGISLMGKGRLLLLATIVWGGIRLGIILAG